MARTVNIDVIRRIRVGEIRISPESMRAVMDMGVDVVKSRVTSGVGPTDGPALPLTPKYAFRKNIILHKQRSATGMVRDLTFTGDMLRSFQTRRVIDNSAIASVDGDNMWVRAGMNQKREPWVVFSPQNKAEVMRRWKDLILNDGGLLKITR